MAGGIFKVDRLAVGGRVRCRMVAGGIGDNNRGSDALFEFFDREDYVTFHTLFTLFTGD